MVDEIAYNRTGTPIVGAVLEDVEERHRAMAEAMNE